MGFGPIFCLCAVVLLVAMVYYGKREEKKTIASIPDEFKYIYVSIANFIAIDLRNQKILLALDGTRKMYDFADIQRYERDTHEEIKRHKRVRKHTVRAIIDTVYDLMLHVNDQVNPTWQFSSSDIDVMDCAELLVSRALDGTLPDTDERRIIDDNVISVKKFKSFLSTGTGSQG